MFGISLKNIIWNQGIKGRGFSNSSTKRNFEGFKKERQENCIPNLPTLKEDEFERISNATSTEEAWEYF